MPYNGTGMKNRSSQARLGKIVALMLLTPMAMFNASQALTLCVRHDGRVAIEPVIEGHCPCGTHPSGADPEQATAGALRSTNKPCQSCADLSLPIGLCQSGSKEKAPGAGNQGSLLSFTPQTISVCNPGEVTPFESPPDWICYHTPLKSIILRV
jgi:hypothetical protein